jgi:hypothetical protein
MNALITPPQSKRIHALLNELGEMHNKANFVHAYGRVTSINEMRNYDAIALIKHLEHRKQANPKLTASEDNNPELMNKLRRRIISACWELNWTTRGDDSKLKADVPRLNAFLLKSGVVRKQLNHLTYLELNKVIGQFKGMVENNGKTAVVAAAKEILNPKTNQANEGI